MSAEFLWPARTLLIEERDKLLRQWYWKKYLKRQRRRLEFIERAIEGLNVLEDLHLRAMEKLSESDFVK